VQLLKKSLKIKYKLQDLKPMDL